jgi:hypothetical protein
MRTISRKIILHESETFVYQTFKDAADLAESSDVWLQPGFRRYVPVPIENGRKAR